MIITRDEAREVIYNLINSGILNEDIENKLSQIATCIEYEQYEMHLWGSSTEDCDILFTSKKDITEQDKEKIDKTIEKYRFEPAPAEVDIDVLP